MKRYAIKIEEIQEDGSRTRCPPLEEFTDGCEMQVTGFVIIAIDEEFSEKKAARTVAIQHVTESMISRTIASIPALASAASRAVKMAAVHERGKKWRNKG